MADHEGAEAAGIGHAAGGDLGGLDHMVAVGEGHGAGVEQEAELHHLAPLAAPGQGRHVADADRARLGGAAGDEFQHLGRVDGGHRVGARDDRGDAARGGGEARRAEALAVALAGLAHLHAEIDDAGGEALAAAVDHLGAGRCLERAHRGDEAALDQQVALGLGSGLGVDQAGVGEKEAHAITPTAARPRSARRFRARRSMQAMRTATPIST